MIVGSLRGKDAILPFSPLLTDFNVDEFEQGLGEGKTGTRPSNEGPHLSNRQTGLLTRWTEPCRGARPPATVLDCARLTRWLQHRFDGDWLVVHLMMRGSARTPHAFARAPPCVHDSEIRNGDDP